MKVVIIAGWGINADEFSQVKSLKVLKKDRRLFDTLPVDQRDAAFAELWKALGNQAEVDTPAEEPQQ